MSEQSKQVPPQADIKDPKPYSRPTLTKGPVLSDVTAFPAGSLIADAAG